MERHFWAHLQEPEAVLTVFHIPAHKALTPPGNQEADALAQICALATDPSVDTAEEVHRKEATTVPRWNDVLPRMPDCP